MTAKALLLALFMWGTIANAGATKAGDGGHGVTCLNGPIQLLDLYEAEYIYGLPLVLPTGQTLDDDNETMLKINEARMRVEGIMGKGHPSLVIFDQAARFLSTAAFKPGAPAETSDAGFPPLPGDCELVQIALRESGDLNFLLTVDSNYWWAASVEERAMLMIHEGAHTWFPSNDGPWPDQTSALRQFVGILYSTGFGDPTSDEQIRKLLTTREPVLGLNLRQ